jgi:hypothetical protein
VTDYVLSSSWILWESDRPVEITGYALPPPNAEEDDISDATMSADDQLDQLLLEVKFRRFRRAWENETRLTSSLTKIVMSPSYQKIIGLGPSAVGLILQEIEKEGEDPDWWFWALEMITGENPISAADQGNNRAMAKAWLEWGKDRAKLVARGFAKPN